MTTSTNPIDIDLYAPDGIARTADLATAGFSQWAVQIRCRPGGAWQRVLPGVILLSAAPPTPRQLLRAALAYAGEQAVLTGVAAMREHGAPISDDGRVHVLIPRHRRVTGCAYVTVERTARLPPAEYTTGMAIAPIVRSTVDAARIEKDPGRLRELLKAPVKAGMCGFDQLRAELSVGNQRGSAAPRVALADLASHRSSLIRARARRVLRTTPLPRPEWDVRIRAGTGDPFMVDAWWPATKLAWVITEPTTPVGTEPHPLTMHMTTVVRTPTTRLRDDPDSVSRQLMAAFLHSARITRPEVLVR
jgi:hypothetical protein